MEVYGEKIFREDGLLRVFFCGYRVLSDERGVVLSLGVYF